MKEPLNALPTINGALYHDTSPEYATEVIDKLLRYFTLSEIADFSGISRRNISYMKRLGFRNYPMQVTLEILAEQCDR